jgi:hypothetical protein
MLDWQRPDVLNRYGRSALPAPNFADHLMPEILRGAAGPSA